MGPSEVEICSHCGREIDRSEQACIFDGKIVCAECDKKLRSSLEVQAEEHSEPVICFFCKKRPVESSSGWPIGTMHRIVDSGGLFGKIGATMKQFSGGVGGFMVDTIVTYKTCQVRIPRCEQCKSAHGQQDEYKKRHMFKSIFGGSALPKGTKPLSHWIEFFEVKNLEKAGWKLGRKPEEKYGYKYIKHEDALK